MYAAICCHLAEACGDLHDVASAREWLLQAVASGEPEPQKAQAYHNLGWHINAFDYDPNEALCWYRRAAAAEPDGTRGYLAAAAILEEQGRFDEALQELLAGLDQVEDPGTMLQTLARTAIQASRWEEVRQAVDQCLQRLPAKEAALGWLKVSRGLTDSHDHRGAQTAIEQAQSVCVLPIDLEATRLSNALKRSEHATAEAAAQRLLQLDPDNLSGLYESAGLALRRSDVPVALGFLERFIKAGGELPYYLTNYAYAAADLDRQPELFAFCEACYTEGQARGHIHLLEIAARHLCGDAEKVDWLVDGLEDIDASKVSEAEIILADMLVNQRRYEEAPPRLIRAIARDPQNTFARCLFVGTELALENIETGIPHLRAILEDPDQDYWAMMALCKTPVSVYPDLQAEADRFQAYFEPFAAAAKQVRDLRVARPRLLTLAHRWHLDSIAAKYAREVLDDRPFPEVIPEIHEVAVESGDLDLADRILAAAQSLRVHPTTIAQLKSITHAMRGEVDLAIGCAYESRHGHGAEFAEMCQRLLETRAHLGDLSDTLFDCMLRYHQGHGPCSTWALLLLFDQGRVAQFEQGLAQTAASIHDYRLAIEQRRSLAAAVAGAKLYRARRTGDLQEQAQIRREIEGMPFFGCDVGKELYQLLGLASNRR